MGACGKLRSQLAECLSKSECLQSGKSAQECLREDQVPRECQQLRLAFMECKRDLLDARKRFRGVSGGGN
ncbi:hypothetical protein E3P92_00212 [Wallemia ichthyophaga]|uniref:Cytochrome c oxidase assembly factor 5 n=2 Tax=Wallemia ichthyophaga TaxID=245174 RepID=A0A4T0GY55_WALIC|nr:Cytochrome c oxidase assembly factor 5 [Wallemia ichthyophaga EXF-994]TIA75350.1 hypothetical protein E3P91_00488 [Wallemia ichthyophaga]EOR04908.1 Cytochrome c oxidase assembly factor 5 [Wallemia ichthyophaga EXF-994]TIA84122.1 hypothetical protein E3P98_00356 [Wallemia ichthyophaga]TIA93480.1 hypothetical protein E3P97_00904 [Wallemia ichthyophaga]TIB00722.1 hypothetical protein E3P95_01576 [Wallemia ichthyophaga]